MLSGLGGVHVLLVEDDAIINLSTSAILEEMGCVVSTAVHLEDAWRMVHQGLPDAAVLDVNLHGNNTSLELADWLEERGIPIVFLTGYQFPAGQGKWRDHPRCRKPFDGNELRRLLIEALNRKHGAIWTDHDRPEP